MINLENQGVITTKKGNVIEYSERGNKVIIRNNGVFVAEATVYKRQDWHDDAVIGHVMSHPQ